MPRNLVELIKASGQAGTAGQSFKSQVTGASGGGVSMTSYLLGSEGSVSGTPAPPGENSIYASGTTFTLGIGFSGYGSNFNQIRRNGTAPWSFTGTAANTINSVTWSESPGTATVSVTVYGVYDSNTIPTLVNFNAWFTGYQSPNEPAGSGAESVSVTPTTTGGGMASGSDVSSIQFVYDPDTALFNPSYTSTTWSFDLHRRAYESWTTRYEWRIHPDANYNNPIGTNSYSFTSYPGDNYTVGYVEYRLKAEYGGGGAYTPYGAVLWDDPREAQ